MGGQKINIIWWRLTRMVSPVLNLVCDVKKIGHVGLDGKFFRKLK